MLTLLQHFAGTAATSHASCQGQSSDADAHSSKLLSYTVPKSRNSSVNDGFFGESE